jgi:hypothetical protein
MYRMGPTMYPIMARFQLPLPQAIALPSRPDKEVVVMDKVDFSIARPSSKQKGDLP